MALEAHIQYARSTWSKIGKGIGLSLDSPRLLPPKLRGSRRDLEVVVSGANPGVSIEVRDVDPWFTLGRDSAMARSIKPDIETGDPDFDELIRVEGDRDFALGLLDYETRQAVERVVLDYEGTVADGSVSATAPHIERSRTSSNRYSTSPNGSDGPSPWNFQSAWREVRSRTVRPGSVYRPSASWPGSSTAPRKFSRPPGNSCSRRMTSYA